MDGNVNTYEDYQKFYSYVDSSTAFKKFCEKVYGIDLSQDGFANKNQIHFLINNLNINENDTVLDIGCGYGKIAKYIQQKTNAMVDGMDYSPIAIKIAKTYEDERMHFFTEDINKLTLQPSKYSKIYLIDTIYFSDDYEKTLMEIYKRLKNQGKIGIYYSDFIFEADKQEKKIDGKETCIANILCRNNWSYSVYDFTTDHYKLMKKRRNVSIKLKQDFTLEGNEFLYKKVNSESIDLDMSYIDFMKFSNRYFYCIEKK